MKRFLFSILTLTSTLFCMAQGNQSKVTSFLEVLDISTGKRTVVKEFDHLIEAPNWSVDGKWLIYNSGGLIYKTRANGKGSPKLLDTGHATECNNDHVLSADGKSIAVSSGPNGVFIYIVPIKGGTAKLAVPYSPSYLHGWSPDGHTFAYCASREGDYDVYTMNIGDKEERRLTTAEGLDDGPEYSPDGKYIWFNSVRTGLMQVWRMRADGSEQTQMTFDEDLNSWFPHVSPDGKQVIFIAYNKGDLKPDEHLANKNVQLRLMSAEGGKPKTVAKLFGGQGTINVNSWSPDSKKVAFVSYRLSE